MKDKISIIVPVYNVEKYLEECLESLINQTYNNIEIILINDGSTDNSLLICKKYEKLDKRIKVIDKNNEGVSKARNLGIKNATGKYLLFVDSDDYLERNAIELLEKEITKEVFIIFGYNRVYKNCIIKNSYECFNIDSRREMERNVFFNDNIGGFIANKVFERSILVKYNILFSEDLSYGEDLVFVCNYIKYCNKFKYINSPIYNYRMRKSSVSYSFFTGMNINILKTYDLLLEMFDDEVIVNNLKYRYIESYYIFKRFLNKEFVNKYILREESKIVKDNCKTIMSLIRFLGIKYFCRLGLLYKKLETIRFKLFE